MHSKLVVGSFVALAALSVPAAALEVVATPSADTVIYRGEGVSETASNGIGVSLAVGQIQDGSTRRSLLRFDLGSIVPGSIVESAQLTMFESRSRADYSVTLHRLLTGWGEGSSDGGTGGQGGIATAGDATWVRAVHPDISWSTPGGDYVAQASASTLVGSALAFYSWSSAAMAADVQSWIDQPATNHGWILIGEELTDQNAKLFNSRQSGTPPSLVLQVTPVPEPSVYAMMLCGVGLVGFALRRRQRQQNAMSLKYSVQA